MSLTEEIKNAVLLPSSLTRMLVRRLLLSNYYILVVKLEKQGQ